MGLNKQACEQTNKLRNTNRVVGEQKRALWWTFSVLQVLSRNNKTNIDFFTRPIQSCTTIDDKSTHFSDGNMCLLRHSSALGHSQKRR